MSEPGVQTTLAAPLICLRGTGRLRRINFVPLVLVAVSLASWALVVWGIAHVI